MSDTHPIMTNSEILDAMTRREGKPPPTFAPLFLLLGTAAFFIVVGAYRWTLEQVLLLAVAIFIHECGHLAAMKAWRYKNLKMLFIPFLGAVASGEPGEQDAYKIAVISMAGPLVGLAAGGAAAALWMLTHGPILAEFARQSVFLNAFNLLPIVPLDGGHFLNEVLLARYPKAELGFKIVAVIGLFALAAAMETWSLAIIGVLVLMTVRVSYLLATAVVRLRSIEGMRDGGLTEDKVGTIREAVAAANPQIEHTRNASRLPEAIAATWARINKVFPGTGRSTVLIAGYAVVVLGLVPLGIKVTARMSGGSAVTAYNAEGNEKLRRGDNDGAIAAYSRAISLAPTEPELFISRGIARTLTGDHDRAISDLTRGLAIKGDDFLGYFFRGHANAFTGEYRKAIHDFGSALRLKPDDASVLMGRGSAEARAGMFGDAIRDLDRSIALDPKNGHAWRQRGYAKDLSGDFAGAAADYEEAAVRLPDDLFLRFRLTLVLRRRQGDDASARLDSPPSNAKDAWAGTIREYLTGRLAEDGFLAQAGEGRGQEQQRHQCEAYYYAGMTHLLRRECVAAGDLFEKCLASNQRSLGEYGLAEAELARLRVDATAAR